MIPRSPGTYPTCPRYRASPRRPPSSSRRRQWWPPYAAPWWPPSASWSPSSRPRVWPSRCAWAVRSTCFSYFTIQATLLVAVVFVASARRARTARRPLPAACMGGTLLYISITGLVYHLILADPSSGFSMTGGIAPHTGWQAVSNQILHTVIPIAAVIDWLLLTRPAPFAVRHATTWLVYPLAYLVFSLVRGEILPPGTPARYLYSFVDVDRHGYVGILGNTAILGVAFYALALLVIALDHVRPDPFRHGSRHPENRISSPATGGLK